LLNVTMPQGGHITLVVTMLANGEGERRRLAGRQ
jgi:hypothetical protein